MQKISISQLGKKVGLSTKTIRFYEESGVISQASREENGYRTYDDAAVETLSLIKNVRDLGLPISEIKELMVGCLSGQDCQHTKQHLEMRITNYISLLERKIKQFSSLKQNLESLNKHIGSDRDDCKYCCNILYQLSNQEGTKGSEHTMNQSCTCCGPECQCGSGCHC